MGTRGHRVRTRRGASCAGRAPFAQRRRRMGTGGARCERAAAPHVREGHRSRRGGEEWEQRGARCERARRLMCGKGTVRAEAAKNGNKGPQSERGARRLTYGKGTVRTEAAKNGNKGPQSERGRGASCAGRAWFAQ